MEIIGYVKSKTKVTYIKSIVENTRLFQSSFVISLFLIVYGNWTSYIDICWLALLGLSYIWFSIPPMEKIEAVKKRDNLTKTYLIFTYSVSG